MFCAIQDSQISMKKVNTIAEMNNYYFSGAGQREILGLSLIHISSTGEELKIK